MPATTPRGYPYPLGSDRVMDGDDSIHDLATAIDTRLGAMAAGAGVLPAPGALNVPTSLAITFPAGRFTVAPIVVATFQGTGPQLFTPISYAGTSASGCTLYAARTSGALTTIPIAWLAIQV